MLFAIKTYKMCPQNIYFLNIVHALVTHQPHLPHILHANVINVINLPILNIINEHAHGHKKYVPSQGKICKVESFYKVKNWSAGKKYVKPKFNVKLRFVNSRLDCIVNIFSATMCMSLIQKTASQICKLL